MNQHQIANPVAPRSRRVIGLFLIVFTLLTVGCASGGDAESSDVSSLGESVTLAEFPEGIGRGYARASLADIDNANNGEVGLQPGDLAPNFRFVLKDGRQVSLHELSQPVVINFWATWCGPCRREMPEFIDAYEANEELVILAVNVQESLETLEPFAEEFGITMPVIRDEEGDIQNLYEVRGMPTTIFIDSDGRIAQVWPGLLTREALDEFLVEIL